MKCPCYLVSTQQNQADILLAIYALFQDSSDTFYNKLPVRYDGISDEFGAIRIKSNENRLKSGKMSR